jgi:transcriptional regulator GlxA family with amidase domain
MPAKTRTVGILLFDDVEVLDACGPFEVFSIARTEDTDGDNELFRVVMIAETIEPVVARGGLIVKPHFTIADHPRLDILLIPGGKGARAVRNNQNILDWIRGQVASIELLTSVCTGALVLAEAGLLDSLSATTHWGAIQMMQTDYPAVTVKSDVRFVEEGGVLTSAGVSAGIDMALHIVSRLHGEQSATLTARQMEYDWRPERF